jgi:hypothetical protein
VNSHIDKLFRKRKRFS